MRKFIKVNITIFILALLYGCSSTNTENIKDWLKKGTKDHQETTKETGKKSKTNLKSFLSQNGCINGSSARIIETKDRDYLLYEVVCVKDSSKFVVKCNEESCSK
jgi:hypothetical protein